MEFDRSTPRGPSCMQCSVGNPVKNITFAKNIGMLVARQTSTVQGAFCGECIMSHYWTCSLTTALVGWFGMISLFATPCILVINMVNLMRSAKLVGWGRVLVGIGVIVAIVVALLAVVVFLATRKH